DVEAQDVTLINYVRSKAQKKFINAFTSDPEVVAQLHGEIDDLSFAYNTRSINDYLYVLKDRILEEAHFSSNIINASPGIIFIYDLVAQKEVYINGRVEEVTGFKPEEVLAIKDFIPQLTHPEDIPVVVAFVQAVVEDKEGKSHHADYRLRNKQGDYHWMRCYATVYRRDDTGQPIQILGAAYDIAGEKEMAQTLLKREKQLLEAQSIGQIGSFEWDIVNDVSVSTPELRKIFESDYRQSLEELLHKVHPDDREKVKAALSEAFVTGNYQCEYRYMAESGEKVLDSRGVVSFDEEKKPLTLIGTIQDITERKRIEESLIRKSLELQQSNIQLQEFASVASHDLKEPLRKIAMYSNIIISTEWDALSEKAKVNLQKITDASLRMQQLIEGVLSYSSLNNQFKQEYYSLEQLLQEAIGNLEYRIKDTNALITSDGLPNAVVAPLQMQQLFQNLISNAIKFIKKGEQPHINITHCIVPAEKIKTNPPQSSKQYLQINISDNGIGFSSEFVDKIFGLFQRLHSKSEYEGSGLGLAICRKIVENHGGSIYASSEEGVGSTFTIVLPYD
ncbi:MAG: PAS domain-containing protein, partial [Flavisolibacter sp.]|nr:PAS domain-containing protein [Flavisolibacter sp.]